MLATYNILKCILSVDFHKKLKFQQYQNISRFLSMTGLFQATVDADKIQCNPALGFHFNRTYSVFIDIINTSLE